MRLVWPFYQMAAKNASLNYYLINIASNCANKGATIRLPEGGGGIFSVTFRAKIFFSIYHEPEYFFSSHTGAEYFLYTIHIWKQLSVCVSDRDDFKWHNIADSKFIATQIYMRVYTPDVSCY